MAETKDPDMILRETDRSSLTGGLLLSLAIHALLIGVTSFGLFRAWKTWGVHAPNEIKRLEKAAAKEAEAAEKAEAVAKAEAARAEKAAAEPVAPKAPAPAATKPAVVKPDAAFDTQISAPPKKPNFEDLGAIGLD